MTARRSLPAFVLLAVASVASAGDPPPPPPLSVTVHTEVLPTAPPTQGKPPEARPVATPLVVELGEPTCAVPEGYTSAMGGVLDRGGRKTTVLVAYDKDGKLALFLDGNCDGTLDPTGECYACAPTAAKQGKVEIGSDGKFESVRLDATKVRATAMLRGASFVANLVVSTENRGVGPSASAVLPLTETKPEGVTTPPALTGKVLYGSATLLGKTFHVALARGDGPALAGVVSEQADLSSPTAFTFNPSPVRRGMRVTGMRWVSTPTAVAGESLLLNAVETHPNAHVSLVGEGARSGTAEVEGAKWQLLLLDADLDGGYDGAADRWWFGPVGALERPNPNNMAEGDAPMLLERDVTWRLTAVGTDGTAVVDRKVEPAASEPTLHRRAERVNASKWFPLFQGDTGFAEARKLDLKRPLAKEPARFRFALTLDEARAMAAAEGKPLLVDFEADWCVWCKRLDYHTYPDAAVAERLARFTAVKINNELDPRKSFRASGWQGIPAVVVYGHDGAPVHFRFQRDGQKEPLVVDHIAGWLKPEEFVLALDAALAAYEDVKAGKPKLELPPPPTRPAPKTPATPKAPEAPKAPDAPEAPKAPDAPGAAPQAPEAPKAPDAPKAPETPPEAPKVPETPKAP